MQDAYLMTEMMVNTHKEEPPADEEIEHVSGFQAVRSEDARLRQYAAALPI